MPAVTAALDDGSSVSSFMFTESTVLPPSLVALQLGSGSEPALSVSVLNVSVPNVIADTGVPASPQPTNVIVSKLCGSSIVQSIVTSLVHQPLLIGFADEST